MFRIDNLLLLQSLLLIAERDGFSASEDWIARLEAFRIDKNPPKHFEVLKRLTSLHF